MKTKEQFVIVDTVQTAGCVSYFRVASDTDLTTLAAAWTKVGLDAALLPKPPKDEVALGRAVNAQAEKRRLVRPLERRGAWAVVEETVQPGATPTYRTLVTVKSVNGNPQVSMADGTALEWAQIDTAVRAAYAHHRNMLAHGDVSAWLIDLAYTQSAVSLRESGGVYFIPRPAVDFWMKVVSAVDAAGSSVFTIPAMRTAEAVAAITDAITAEATAMAQTVEDELMLTGDEALGKRALNTRVETAMELLKKLSTYEELIGQQLEIRKRVELLSANVTAAALTAQVAEAA
jgi:hypothetical protein